ncbi:hypothetical protein [Rhodopirellula bahusiensis]|uniref:hypothetical protein n=1 Tax=Rhodopirellula bahusiensis TaxID=2014065 RepID=UPI0032676A68
MNRETKALWEHLRRLQATVDALSNRSQRSLFAVRILEGVIAADATIEESEEDDSFELGSLTVQVFDADNPDGTNMAETPIQIDALCGVVGSFTAGSYAAVFEMPDGTWRLLSASCSPVIPDYEPPEPEPE